MNTTDKSSVRTGGSIARHQHRHQRVTEAQLMTLLLEITPVLKTLSQAPDGGSCGKRLN